MLFLVTYLPNQLIFEAYFHITHLASKQHSFLEAPIGSWQWSNPNTNICWMQYGLALLNTFYYLHHIALVENILTKLKSFHVNNSGDLKNIMFGHYNLLPLIWKGEVSLGMEPKVFFPCYLSQRGRMLVMLTLMSNDHVKNAWCH